MHNIQKEIKSCLYEYVDTFNADAPIYIIKDSEIDITEAITAV